MATITWTNQAEFWLKEIFDYIALDNPIAAANVINDIYEKAQLLEHNPQLGYQYNHESGLDIRILLYGHYRITYLIKNNVEIEILGVFHGALDIEKYLVS
ncbi:hypothetical protein MNBD_GAMMA21-1115 [hydrothermal vent metagenome]|uniref:Death on curing protein, Doc toxin n=1 Tax=hydrothermal vent metagenome TaxID=652676 RepID=A0A3B1AM95_9ZZZZ